MIEEIRWYSITELMSLAKDGIVPYRSRTTWLELIRKGVLPHLVKGDIKKKVYVIQGKDILEYLKSMKVPKR